MHRMLDELFYGNIDPSNKQFIQSSQYAKAMKTISETEEKLH